MDRRSFLASIAAATGSLILPGRVFAQASSGARSSAAQQSDAIRSSASQLLRTLAPERRSQVLFPFPKGQTPAAIGFGHMPGGFGGPGGGGHPGHRVAFDINGNPTPDAGPGPGGPPPGGGGPGGPGFGPPPGGPNGDHHGGPMAAGEKYGQAVWTNFPVSNVPRPGVQMGQFTAAERAAVHGLLQTVLSPMGYQKVLDIMTADQVVADAGTDYAAGLNVYTLAFFGEPGATAPWMLQFGGHHLGLNVTFVGDKAVCSPLHTGILPARFKKDGRIVRGLGPENDKAFDLFATFTPGQVKAASIDHNVSDLVFGPGHPDATLPLQGLRAADMTERQRTMLLSLITEWTGVLNDAHAASRLDEIRHSLTDTHFAWSGPATHEPGYNGEAYFRIHGPSLIIEHAPQGNQGGYKVHVHTIMRDLGNDYAKQLV